MEQEKAEHENAIKSGKIAAEVVKYAKSIIKPDMKLLEIAEKTEAKILALGAKPAFPVNLSINEISAHYTPSVEDETLSHDLLKVDIGIHIDGEIADTAFSLDLTEDKKFTKLIQASQEALDSGIKIIKQNIELNKIGKAIHDTITKYGFSPIRNLCGHELQKWKVHSGLTIPNYDNGNETKLEKGLYAIEPFATSGAGIVYDGKPSGIYKFEQRKAIRDLLARQILEFIEKEYKTLPFCSRWIAKKFGKRALLSLSLMEKAGILHHFPQLIEKQHSAVSQAEHTILINDKVTITTL